MSLLGGDSENLLSPVRERAERFQLQKDGVVLSVRERRVQTVPDVDGLLLFSAYAGVGIKTTLGMGGVQTE